MKQSIKNRITEIQTGKIPEGYKKTEVGIVPKDWQEHKLADFFNFKNGLNKEKEAFGKGIPIINYTDVWKNRGLTTEHIKGKVNLSPKEIDNYSAKEGDVFFTRTSETKDEIGFSSVLLENISNCVFSGFILRARPQKQGIAKEYNQYCYSSNFMRHEIIRKSSITTRALTNGKFLGEVKINLPSLPEQQKIAEVLMKWDEAIDLMDKLVKKLEIRKKALMQKLFSLKNGWKRYDMGRFLVQKSQRNSDSNIKNVLSINNKRGFIQQVDQFDKVVASNDISNYKIIKKDYIAYNPSRINVGSIACYDKDEFGIVSPMYIVFEVKGLLSYYFIEFIKTARFQYELQSLLSGSVRDTLNFVDLCQTTILLPATLSEQQHIADILSTADDEIELNKRKLDKMREQKKALMQLLLTGIVRVK